MKEELKVSIIVPVYNVAPYIERCLKSVMQQSYDGELECLIVDDCGTDDSIPIAQKVIDAYTGPIRFEILHHEHNRGLSAARNTGTKQAKGDYIFYLDSDDELTPDCIEKLAKPIEKDSSIEMVVGNYQKFPENPSISKIVREEEFTSSAAIREFFFDRRILSLSVAAWNKLMSKQFITDHKLSFIEGTLFEDIPWIYYVMKYLQHLYVIPDITYHYCVRPFSICTGSSENEKAKYYGIVYEEIAKHFTPGEEAREAKYYLYSYFNIFIRNRRMESFKRTLPLFDKALAGDDYRKERLRLWVLRLSSRSAFLHGIFAVLLIIRRVILYPFRRLAFLWKKEK